jgi:hypothetical protein
MAATRGNGKAAGGKGLTAARTEKRRVPLSAETYRRLRVHAVGTGQTPSQVLEQLVRANCRRFVIQDREGPPEPEGSPGAAA